MNEPCALCNPDTDKAEFLRNSLNPDLSMPVPAQKPGFSMNVAVVPFNGAMLAYLRLAIWSESLIFGRGMFFYAFNIFKPSIELKIVV